MTDLQKVWLGAAAIAVVGSMFSKSNNKSRDMIFVTIGVLITGILVWADAATFQRIATSFSNLLDRIVNLNWF